MKKDFILKNLNVFVKKMQKIIPNFKMSKGINLKKILTNVKFVNIRQKLKISQKLHLVCALAISMNVIMLIIVLSALHTAEQRMDSFYHVEYKNSIQQMQIRNDVASLDHAILSAVFSEDYQESNQAAEQAVQKAVADINILKKSFLDEQLMKELNMALNDFLTQEMKVMSYAFAGQTDKALDAIHGDYSQCVSNLYTILDTVSVKAEDAANLALQETVQQRQKMTMLLIVSMVTLGILLLLAAGINCTQGSRHKELCVDGNAPKNGRGNM